MDYSQASLDKHKQFKGKIGITSKFGPIITREDLSTAYTPVSPPFPNYWPRHRQPTTIPLSPILSLLFPMARLF